MAIFIPPVNTKIVHTKAHPTDKKNMARMAEDSQSFTTTITTPSPHLQQPFCLVANHTQPLCAAKNASHFWFAAGSSSKDTGFGQRPGQAIDWLRGDERFGPAATASNKDDQTIPLSRRLHLGPHNELPSYFGMPLFGAWPPDTPPRLFLIDDLPLGPGCHCFCPPCSTYSSPPQHPIVHLSAMRHGFLL